MHAERVTEPGDVVDALKRAQAANDTGQPAYIEFVCCQYPGVRRMGARADRALAHIA